MASEIVKAPNIDQAGAIEVRAQVNQIQYLMKEVLQNGEHYGTVPGCGKKPTLLQPGAEKIAYMFHFVPTYEVTRVELGNGHREYETKCTLVSRDTGERVGEGLGTCSTLESKYRYRYEGYGNSRKKVENLDIADQWNTVLKMSKKRAFVDAVKSTTAASDIFTQDIEDMAPYQAPQAQAQAAPQPPQPDPRKPLWKEVGELKARALELGANEDGITSWMSACITNQDGSPKPTNVYTVEEIVRLRDHLKQNIADLEALNSIQQTSEEVIEAEYIEPDYSSEDIPF